jgi:hypothetical protein
MPFRSFTFGASGTFNVPSDIRMVWVTASAGGGGGGGVSSPTTVSAAGGGGGEACYNVPYHVTPGGTVAVVVGIGGSGSAGTGTAGGDTSFGTLVLRGGQPGGGTAPPLAGSGGTGGGLNLGIAGRGKLENNTFFSGAGGQSGNIVSARAGPAAPYLGGAVGGTDGTRSGGGGGAASIFGSGGDGGDGGFVNATIPGHASASTAYGAAGGGSGGTGIGPGFINHTPQNGGNGTRGYVTIAWIGA